MTRGKGYWLGGERVICQVQIVRRWGWNQTGSRRRRWCKGHEIRYHREALAPFACWLPDHCRFLRIFWRNHNVLGSDTSLVARK